MGAINQKLQGIIIRRRRQELAWSQTTLCDGVCAVSYLSKIEQGKAEASSEVLQLLFQRLGIRWRAEPEFCRQTAAWFEDWYDCLFSGEETDALGQELAARREEYRNSPFLLDYLLLTWLTAGEPPEDMEEYVPTMNVRQRNLYLCLNKQFDELLWTTDQSYFLLKIGEHHFVRGRYTDAVAYLQRCVDQACREGSLSILMLCQMWLGNCYSALNQLSQTQKFYAAAIRMARRLGRQVEMKVITYNLATTELQMGLTEEALRHLLERPWDEAMYFHKLAICYEQLGQKDRALAALDQAQAAPQRELTGDPVQVREVFEQMCQLVRFRLEDPHYVKNPQYGSTLISCIRSQGKLFPMSFVRFHARWLEEWYTANRQYQKAYETVRSIFLENTF